MAKAGKKPSRRQLREHCFKLLFCVGFHPAGDMQAQMERYFQGIPEEESDGLDSAPPEDRDGFKAWESTMPAAPVGRKGRRGGKGGALPGAGRSFGGEVSQGGAEALPGAGRSFGGEVSRSGEEALTGAAGGGVALSPAGAGLIHDVAVSDGDREKIRARVTAVVEAIPRLDARIREVAIGWTVGRIGKAELAILRLALYEMLFDPDIPEKVAVNEAVEIAKKYGGKDASAFINGVLSQFIFEEKG